MTDPVSGAAAVAGIVETIQHVHDGLKDSKPQSRALTIRCPEGIAEYTVLVHPGRIRKKAKVTITAPNVTKISTRSLPSFLPCNAVAERSGGGVILDSVKIGPKADAALLTIEYELDGRDVVSTLVASRWKADSYVGGDEEKHWMTAQLRYLKALETGYGEIDLRDVDVSVNIGIYERLRAAMPLGFLRSADTLIAAIRESERNRRFDLLGKYRELRMAKSSSDDYSKFAELNSVFITPHFREFVDVQPPFFYWAAYPGRIGAGREAYEPPKFSQVVSRLDLSRHKPAAEGYLVYKSKRLMDHLDQIFR